jgi:outer membrane protein TolC
MLLEDQIASSIRHDLRSLAADRSSFEIARQSLVTAARTVEAARERLLVAEKSDNNTTTIEILNALNSLLQAKTTLINSWVRYETDRIQLLLDLEALQLDERGLPTDESENPSSVADDTEPLAAPRTAEPGR